MWGSCSCRRRPSGGCATSAPATRGGRWRWRHPARRLGDAPVRAAADAGAARLLTARQHGGGDGAAERGDTSQGGRRGAGRAARGRQRDHAALLAARGDGARAGDAVQPGAGRAQPQARD
eukprot:7381065-Prymnesium_polylepis.2